MSTLDIGLIVLGGLVLLAVLAAVIRRQLVRRGRREPLVVAVVNRISARVVDTIKRPITIAVLDEVADVLQTGHYTRNISAALAENHEEIMEMVAEKIKQDPTGRRLALVPFHDQIIRTASETTLRVVLQVLADPRTDELVSDLLRDNITQIRRAVRAKERD